MRIMKRILCLTLGVFACLGGCTMVPQYVQPTAPVPAEWPVESQAEIDVPEASQLKWQEFFTDEDLQQVIKTALSNNRDLRLAVLNIERSRALYRIQRAEVLPTVNGTGNGIKQRLSADSFGSDGSRTVEQYSAGLGISSWEIDFFGRIRSLAERGQQEYLATVEARRSAQILLISEVANAYLTLAADQESLQLSQLTLESQREAYELIRRRFELGLATELDLRQVQGGVDAARVDVARFAQLIAQDRNALNLLAGSPLPTALLRETLAAITTFPDVSPGIPSQVLLYRPDIIQAENLLKAANANIGAARAALFPRISLTTAIGTASGDLSGLFKSGTDTWNFSPQVVLPIFDARAWLAMGVTETDREIAKTQYERAIQSAFREVADALAQRANVGEQLTAQQSLVDANTESYRLSNSRYNKGIDIFLNVLDAQRSLYAAQQGLLSLRLAKLANQATLYAVLGGGGGDE